MIGKIKTCMGDTCLFCNAKCLECGSTNIKVQYLPIYEFVNDTDNQIWINRVGGRMVLECIECKARIGDDGFGKEVDPRLIPLATAMDETLQLPAGAIEESKALDNGHHENEVTLWG